MASMSSSDAVMVFTDHVSTKCIAVFLVFYSIGNCFDQIEPFRSATERSGVRNQNYILGYYATILTV